jgi:hypothetical protein
MRKDKDAERLSAGILLIAAILSKLHCCVLLYGSSSKNIEKILIMIIQIYIETF